MGPIAGIDHVIVGVRDLDAARSTWTRLGFTLSPRGRHLDQPTGNYCVMFASDYIELLGVVDDGKPTLRVGEFLSWREGPMGIAFSPSRSVEEAHLALTGRGFHPTQPRRLMRQIELAEKTALLRFSLVSLPSQETPDLDCFLCGHLTPELMRRQEWLHHPNGANGLSAVHVLVESTQPLLAAYDRLFGIVQVTTTDAVAVVHAGRHRLVFSTPDDFQTMHPGIELGRGFALPGMIALELAIERRKRTVAFLTDHQISFSEMSDGSLAVPRHEANGAMLLFGEG
jgi:catechol 2,3-dioxygenase-like lactoylglutathione lyase family enzyme